MQTLTFSLPAMYADHHVAEVRRLLLAMPGVEDVYASSAFQTAEVTYDPLRVDAAAVEKVLDEAGYLGELPLPVETGMPVTDGAGAGTYFRHTASYVQATKVVGFSQNVSYAGRPLWPCPGMGPVKHTDN